MTAKKTVLPSACQKSGSANEPLVVVEAGELDVAPVREARDVHVGEAHGEGDEERQDAEGDEQQHRGGDEERRG